MKTLKSFKTFAAVCSAVCVVQSYWAISQFLIHPGDNWGKVYCITELTYWIYLWCSREYVIMKLWLGVNHWINIQRHLIVIVHFFFFFFFLKAACNFGVHHSSAVEPPTRQRHTMMISPQHNVLEMQFHHSFHHCALTYSLYMCSISQPLVPNRTTDWSKYTPLALFFWKMAVSKF